MFGNHKLKENDGVGVVTSRDLSLQLHKSFLYAIFVVIVLFLANTFSTYAALKDSDVDGLTDEAEVNTYHTDPNKADTDGDGFDDGYEVVNGTDPLDANSTPFATEIQIDSETQSFLTNKHIFEAFGVSILIVGCFFLIRSFVSKKTGQPQGIAPTVTVD